MPQLQVGVWPETPAGCYLIGQPLAYPRRSPTYMPTTSGRQDLRRCIPRIHSGTAALFGLRNRARKAANHLGTGRNGRSLNDVLMLASLNTTMGLRTSPSATLARIWREGTRCSDYKSPRSYTRVPPLDSFHQTTSRVFIAEAELHALYRISADLLPTDLMRSLC